MMKKEKKLFLFKLEVSFDVIASQMCHRVFVDTSICFFSLLLLHDLSDEHAFKMRSSFSRKNVNEKINL